MTGTPILFKGMFGTFTVFLLLSIGCRSEQSNPRELPPIAPRPVPVSARAPVGARSGRLRIQNVGAEPILRLVVAFPEETVLYGDIGPGETTKYQDVIHGVYGHAAFGWVWKRRTIPPRTIDWVGERPSPGDFTYQVTTEPYGQTEYVRLVAVVRDVP